VLLRGQFYFGTQNVFFLHFLLRYYIYCYNNNDKSILFSFHCLLCRQNVEMAKTNNGHRSPSSPSIADFFINRRSGFRKVGQLIRRTGTYFVPTSCDYNNYYNALRRPQSHFILFCYNERVSLLFRCYIPKLSYCHTVHAHAHCRPR